MAKNFYASSVLAKNVLVLDLGFLGDTIHLVPALKVIRDAYPDAKLSVMVAEHVANILQLTPWVDRILGYPRPYGNNKRRRWWQDFGWIWKLRKERYNVVINLNGSERSSILTRFSGAPLRLGRITEKSRRHFKWYYTHTLSYPQKIEPLYRQRCACLQSAGFPFNGIPNFDVTLPDHLKNFTQQHHLKQPFVHISLCTGEDSRNIPLDLLAAFINQVKPYYVLSCAPTERERSQLKFFLTLIQHSPQKIFDGTLSTLELAALIAGSQLHMGGDSGALHIAVMMDTPALAWFPNNGNREWQPAMNERYKVILGTPSEKGLYGINFNEMLENYYTIVDNLSCKSKF